MRFNRSVRRTRVNDYFPVHTFCKITLLRTTKLSLKPLRAPNSFAGPGQRCVRCARGNTSPRTRYIYKHARCRATRHDVSANRVSTSISSILFARARARTYVILSNGGFCTHTLYALFFINTVGSVTRVYVVRLLFVLDNLFRFYIA